MVSEIARVGHVEFNFSRFKNVLGNANTFSGTDNEKRA